MNKSTHFSGTPIIKQILKFIQQIDVNRTAEQYNSDRYYKKFKTYEFITNNLEISPDKVAYIYKHRWQGETMFKRLK